MPITQCQLPSGAPGFRWGSTGKCYADRKDAERQEAAARTHGWAGDEKPRSMYVSRKLLNADAVIEWAKSQGFTKPLAADDMHVTVAYSRTPVPWMAAGDSFDKVRASDVDGGERAIEKLGNDGAVVLQFDNPDLRRRWQEFREAGASWDWEGYKPHVTFTYEPGDVDLSKVTPYAGPLEFGPEHYAEIDNDWEKKVKGAMDHLALDRDSVRTRDQDGRLRVEMANISKAIVNPYIGNEISDWEELGLEAKKVYQLLRDPAELEKAAPTFNGVPLLDTHVPSTAWDHPFGKVVGTTGTDAVFEAPYLKNSLVVWTADAIAGIETDEKRELSCGYRYRADMTPGTYDGVKYDGVMRDILGNHVALVAAGRAGPDVIVGDSQPVKGNGMTKVKAIARKAAALRGAFLVSPKAKAFAMDAKVNEIVAAITKANWKEQRPKLEAAIKPKMANDADMEDVIKLIDMVEKEEEGMDDEVPPAAAAVDANDPIEKIMAMLKGKVDDTSLAAIGEMLKGMKPAAAAVDEEPPKKDDGNKDNKDMVSKSAMDAALKAASGDADKRIKEAADKAASDAETKTIARLNAINQAQDSVQPWVGKLSGAFDSAEGVYRAALTAMNVKHDGVHESALRHVLEAQPKPGHAHVIAQDAKPADGFEKRFPGVAGMRVIG